MTPVDWAIVGVVLVSIVLGVVRGLLREILSLAGWIGGVLLALRFAVPLGQMVPLDVPPAAATALAAVAIVLGCVIAAALLALALRAALKAIKLSGLDRLLGALFGLVRGALVVGVAVFVSMGTALAKEPFWNDSLLLPHIGPAVQGAVRWMAPMLSAPRQLAQG